MTHDKWTTLGLEARTRPTRPTTVEPKKKFEVTYETTSSHCGTSPVGLSARNVQAALNKYGGALTRISYLSGEISYEVTEIISTKVVVESLTEVSGLAKLGRITEIKEL